MFRFLRFGALFGALLFSVNAFAAGYTCPSYKKYTSCSANYYLSECGTTYDGRTLTSSSLTAGNSCKSCPSGYTCSGGLVCPKASTVAVSYNLNGGSGTTPSATSCTMGSACTLTSGATTTFYRAGYQFVGWATSNTATTGSTSITVSAATTVYAVWTACSAGTYKTSSAQASAACSSCAAGSYNNTTASTSCTTCSAGTFNTAAGSTSCSTCTAGYWCPGGSTRTACSTLGTGYTSASGAGANTSCYLPVAGGSVRSGSSGTTLTTCLAGTYRAAHNAYYGTTYTCTACTGRTKYSGAGASACSTVSSGYYTTGCNSSNNNCTGQSQCTSGTWCASGVQNNCPTADSGWTVGSPAGSTAYTGCYETKTGTAISSYCSAGVLKRAASSTTAYSSTVTISTALQAAAGSIVSGQTCTQCTGRTFSAGGTATSCTACLAAESGWTAAGGGTGQSSYTTCKETKTGSAISSYCSAGVLTKTQSSATAWATTATITTALQAAAGSIVSGQTCAQCTGTTYSAGGTATACSSCPDGYTANTTAGKSANTQCTISCAAGTRVATANEACAAITSGNVYMLAHTVNYGSTSAAATSCPTGYSISGTTSADHDEKSDCKISCSAGTQVVTTDAACTTPTGSWYAVTHSVAAGTTSGTNVKACLTNYSTPSTTVATDHDAATDCTISCAAGTRIATANATSCTTPSGNWYVSAHSVAQGSTSSVNSCLTNYTISGTATTDHDAASDCKISCGGGSYIEAANDTSCANVGAGYWAAASVVPQGSAGVRNACETGMTTIGYGAGADEAGDCGRVLHIGDGKIYLRSVKKTTTSLAVGINGTTYYGNMDTATKGTLRINSGGTTYSVYDDSM